MSKNRKYPKLVVRQRTVVLWIIFAVLTFFAGFRWDVGIDWPTYMGLFDGGLYEMALKRLERIEPASLFIKGLLLLGGYTDGGYYLWVMAFITIFLYFYSIYKYSNNKLFSASLFVLLGIYFSLMNGVRQHAAVAITVFAWQFLFEKKIVRYMLTILIASLFHTSALIMLPVYFVCNIRFNKKLLIIMAIIAVPLSFVMTPLIANFMGLFEQYEVYQDSPFVEATNARSILRVLYPLSLFTIIMALYNKLIADRKIHILTNLALISIFCTLFFPGVSLMVRTGYYVNIALIFVIPIVCKTLNRRSGIIFKWFSILYSIVFLISTQLGRSTANLLPFDLDFRLADLGLLHVLFICLISSIGFIYLMRIGIKRSQSASKIINEKQ